MLHCPTCGKEYSEDLKFCPHDSSLLQADATNASEAPVDPLLGRTLDEKYLLEEKLGIGGMGTVYRARHLLIDRAVAVKVLNQRFVEDEAAKARFRREAKAAGRLQHTNAVGVTDFGETSDGYVYLVMELLEGKTLQSLLARNGPLDLAHAVSIVLQVSSAVAAAHEAGVIHRDLKPANIFIVHRSDVPSVVKVLDFGIAKLAADSVDDEDRMTLTQVGVMIGTPRYMSPEQCNGDPLTPAADVYSLGVILYEMLTGTVPFSGMTPLAIAMRHSTELPRPPREVVTTIPEQLEQVVLHALEKKPQDRPQNAGAFREELLDTAERLGLEHAAASTAPSMEALRNAGTESPSGRLVVDLSRLREHRAATSGAGEFPTILKTDAERILAATAPAAAEVPSANEVREIRRIDVPIQVVPPPHWLNKKSLAIISALLVLLVVTGIAWMVSRSRQAATDAGAVVVASPSPETSPTPSPSPSASPSPSPRRQDAAKKPQKKESKVGSVLNKFKKILKKRF
ncbi:MAG TPA: serine/threonine-protein kinase [Pyrinomonadaceae bacterium]|nr:serine/threonine-protein kinase [Pyrinomonadaceae bacterium]